MNLWTNPRHRRIRVAASFAAALSLSGLAPTALGQVLPQAESGALSRRQAVQGADGAKLGTIGLRRVCAEPAHGLLQRGVALLHHMTFTEAETAFRQAVEIDPSCALGYWGIAASYVHPVWPDVLSGEQLAKGRELLDKARDLAIPDGIEAAYAGALSAYYDDTDEPAEPQRLQRLAEGWERAREAYPDDTEAAAFYALALLATATAADGQHTARRQAGDVLAELLAEIPDHPGGLHYTIHAYDVPALADQALQAANTYGAVAPDNAHALHMTSHIFTRLGLWEESIDFNLRSAAAAWHHPIGGRVSHHYLHAIDYLVYGYLQTGEDDAARRLVERLVDLGPIHDHAASAYPIAAVAARYALEPRRWDEAVELQERPAGIDWDKYPHLEAIPVFARAIGAARTRQTAIAAAAIERLAELGDLATAVPDAYDWATQVEIQRLAATAWLRKAEGDDAEALRLAAQAADLESSTDKNPVTPGEALPARELYADMLMEAGDYAAARSQYDLAMERSPNRFHSLLSAGKAARLAGDTESARDYFDRLLDLAGDSDRPEIGFAREFVGR